jgi:hypothetical protein
MNISRKSGDLRRQTNFTANLNSGLDKYQNTRKSADLQKSNQHSGKYWLQNEI